MIIALGGHVLQNLEESYLKKYLSSIPKKSVITHGNGPHVGDLYVNTKIPLHLCVAMTQGLIGYPISNVTGGTVLVTRILVDKKDPAFGNPTKPIGSYYKTKPKIKWNFVKTQKGYRRVVASPTPKKILDIDKIVELRKKVTVIAAGGGGIPVVKKAGGLVGIDAVIDKDFATQKLANSLEEKKMVIITEERGVFENYGKPNQKMIKNVSLDELADIQKEGHFPAGSMGPKVQACMNFINYGGKKAIIGNIQNLKKTLSGKSGTTITR